MGQRFVLYMRPGVNVGKPNYDSSIWEPDDEMLAAQEGTFHYLFSNMKHIYEYNIIYSPFL